MRLLRVGSNSSILLCWDHQVLHSCFGWVSHTSVYYHPTFFFVSSFHSPSMILHNILSRRAGHISSLSLSRNHCKDHCCTSIVRLRSISWIQPPGCLHTTRTCFDNSPKVFGDMMAMKTIEKSHKRINRNSQVVITAGLLIILQSSKIITGIFT